tara:strand:+ start:317 stop:1270 length:954 start_codon:yes stop_codon:yes gene_type:complete
LSPELKAASDPAQQNFYQVLREVFSDFREDIKQKKVPLKKKLILGKVNTNETLPKDFKRHLTLILKRLLTRYHDSVLVYEPKEAEQRIDLYFQYYPEGMIASIGIFDLPQVTDKQESSIEKLAWSGSYDSITSRAERERRPQLEDQIDRSVLFSHYNRRTLWRPTVQTAVLKDLQSLTSALYVGMRISEQYDYRRKEAGLELGMYFDLASLSGASGNTALFSRFNLNLLFNHHWNFFGRKEVENEARDSAFAGAGFTWISETLISPYIQGGYEWRLGKLWIVSGSIGYRLPVRVFGTESSGTTYSTPELKIGLAALF